MTYFHKPVVRPRSGIMLAKPFEQRYLDKMGERVIAQPKIDGVRMRAVPFGLKSPGYALFSSTGLNIGSLLHINSALNWLFRDTSLEDLPVLDGEAYIHGMLQQDISSIVSRTVNAHPDSKDVQFHIFDLVDAYRQSTRVLNLSNLFKRPRRSPYIQIVESRWIDPKSWTSQLSTYKERGYEGIILRDPNALYTFGKQSCILKFKPAKHDTYTIIGTLEAISKEGLRKGMLGALMLVDSHGNRFKCGAGLTSHPERVDLWERRDSLITCLAKVKYLRLTKKGVPREPVLVEIKEKANGT